MDAGDQPAPESNDQPHSTQPQQTTQDTNGAPASPQSKPKTSNPVRRSSTKKKPPGGFDATPLPDAPQGYTVRFTFTSASNLPPADFHTASADPYLVATLKASAIKRHKEDPDLTHRTQTIHKTTEPEWRDRWVVANVPATGFTLKCRMYDEDSPNKNDRLGNVTIKVDHISDDWKGFPPPGKEYEAKKRVIAKRAYVLKGISSIFKSQVHMTPRLTVSIEVLGKSDPPFAQMCTLGPTTWVRHFSPMMGRLVGLTVDAKDEGSKEVNNQNSKKGKGSQSQKYDFQANEMQLSGPVPSELYHRFVTFRPIIGSMFSSHGVRGKILNKALHKQHGRVYSFDRATEYGDFEACSEHAALQFLKLVHFDEGGRIFTYVLTLDGMFRFTETGKEFGIDLLSKHTMHSNVATYIACSGEFFIRRLQHAAKSDDPDPNEKTHPKEPIEGGPPNSDPPKNPSKYQLVIDNDSGTYRPDKSILPHLKGFLEKNFPGLGVVAMHWEEEKLQKMKEGQTKTKKKEGQMVNLVMNSSQSSISSAESALNDRDGAWEHGHKSKREAAFAAVENPKKAHEAAKTILPHGKAEKAPA